MKNDIIIGFLRLRKPSEYAHRREITSNTLIIRELHVYGFEVPINKKPDFYQFQHRGLGRKLLEEGLKFLNETIISLQEKKISQEGPNDEDMV